MISTLLALSLTLAAISPEADESFDRTARLLADPQSPAPQGVSRVSLLERRALLVSETPGLGAPVALLAGGAGLGCASAFLWWFLGSAGILSSLDRGWGMLLWPMVILVGVASGVSLAAMAVGVGLLARNLSLRAKAEEELRALDAALATPGPYVPLPSPAGALAQPTVR